MTSHDPEFWEKAGNVCGLYLSPPENVVVWSVDEKSGMQAKSRVNPTEPAVPGTPARREFEYRRHGTAVLFAGLDVHEGTVAGWVAGSTRSTNFIEFLADLVAQTPQGLDLHCIVDHLQTHKTPGGAGFLGPMCTCISHRPMPVGSTRGCSSPSWSAGCCAGASSAPSGTWPGASLLSLRTTTDEQRRSAGRRHLRCLPFTGGHVRRSPRAHASVAHPSLGRALLP